MDESLVLNSPPRAHAGVLLSPVVEDEREERLGRVLAQLRKRLDEPIRLFPVAASEREHDVAEHARAEPDWQTLQCPEETEVADRLQPAPDLVPLPDEQEDLEQQVDETLHPLRIS